MRGVLAFWILVCSLAVLDHGKPGLAGWLGSDLKHVRRRHKEEQCH